MLLRRQHWLKALTVSLAALVLAVPARAVQPDPLVPADAELVVNINVRQILDSAVIKKNALDKIKKDIKDNAEVQKLMEATGLDPLKDVDTVVLAVAGLSKPKFLLVMHGKFNPEKIHSAVEAAAKKDDNLKISKEGNLNIYETTKGKDVFCTTVLDRSTVLLAQEKDYLLKAAKSDGKAMISKGLQGALSRVTGKESIWGAMYLSKELKDTIAKNPMAAQFANKMEAITGSLNLADGANFILQIHTADAQAAGQLGKAVEGIKALVALQVKGQPNVPQSVKDIVDNLMVNTKGTSVGISLDVTEEQIEKVIKESKDNKEK
jgi:hypothetical protein